MALCDYKLCDVCGTKAFFDARLNYDFDPDEGDEKVKGEGYTLDYLGDWAVVCRHCAKTHKCEIVALPPEEAS